MCGFIAGYEQVNIMDRDDWAEAFRRHLKEIADWGETGENRGMIGSFLHEIKQIFENIWAAAYEAGYEEGFRVGSGADRDD